MTEKASLPTSRFFLDPLVNQCNSTPQTLIARPRPGPMLGAGCPHGAGSLVRDLGILNSNGTGQDKNGVF